MIWRIPGISLNLHYPKEDDGELYTACPIIKGSRGIEPLNPLPQRRIRLTLPAYLCLKTALRRSEIREYYTYITITLVHNTEHESVLDFVSINSSTPYGGCGQVVILPMQSCTDCNLQHYDKIRISRSTTTSRFERHNPQGVSPWRGCGVFHLQLLV